MYIFVTSRSNRSSTSLFNIAHHHQRIPVKLDHPITKLLSRVSKGSAPIQKKQTSWARYKRSSSTILCMANQIEKS